VGQPTRPERQRAKQGPRPVPVQQSRERADLPQQHLRPRLLAGASPRISPLLGVSGERAARQGHLRALPLGAHVVRNGAAVRGLAASDALGWAVAALIAALVVAAAGGRFIEEVRGDDPELAKPLRIEERELEAVDGPN
jgi:hypothetical protein